LPNNQRQHRTSHAPKDVLPLRIVLIIVPQFLKRRCVSCRKGCEASPPNHHDDKVDSDPQVVNTELFLSVLQKGVPRSGCILELDLEKMHVLLSNLELSDTKVYEP